VTAFSLEDAYRLKQDELLARLRKTAAVSHPTEKGDISEEAWAKLLNKLLPSRYQVSKASIVDCRGGRSQAIDVVIHDRHFSPLVFRDGKTLLLPAESVYAVFECKQTLDKGHLTYAGKKAASVRQLHRTSAPVVHAGGVVDKPKPPPPILAGVLTTTSRWKTALGDPFLAALPAEEDHRLDLGCVVQGGAWEISPSQQAPTIAPAEKGLVFFVVRLLARLQMLGSAPAMDYDEWAVPL
jgi:hypothetical protein